MIVLVVVLIFIFIGNRYVCMQRLREIDRLQQQLRDVRFEALSISSELTGNSRQSQIELLIEEQGIELEAAKNPPYELYKNKLLRVTGFYSVTSLSCCCSDW